MPKDINSLFTKFNFCKHLFRPYMSSQHLLPPTVCKCWQASRRWFGSQQTSVARNPTTTSRLTLIFSKLFLFFSLVCQVTCFCLQEDCHPLLLATYLAVLFEPTHSSTCDATERCRSDAPIGFGLFWSWPCCSACSSTSVARLHPIAN